MASPSSTHRPRRGRGCVESDTCQGCSMPLRERIVVAMSGGVDSSVAAARLLDAGLRRGRRHAPPLGLPRRRSADGRGATGAAARPRTSTTRDASPTPSASRTSRSTGASSSRGRWSSRSSTPTSRGETPSPCTACNRGVKLAELFALADRLGAARVATGHYARIVARAPAARRGSRWARTRRRTRATSSTRPRARGSSASSSRSASRPRREVRAEALARRLPGAGKGESQELCFVGAGVARVRGLRRARGRVAGAARAHRRRRRDASSARTTGCTASRSGSARGSASRWARPAFVTRIDPARATVHLGGEDALRLRGGGARRTSCSPTASPCRRAPASACATATRATARVVRRGRPRTRRGPVRSPGPRGHARADRRALRRRLRARRRPHRRRARRERDLALLLARRATLTP